MATLLVLVHALAPGAHAIQLRIEQQQGRVVRSCCFAGNALVGSGREEPTRTDHQRTRLIQCEIGRLLLSNHQYVPPAPRLPLAPVAATASHDPDRVAKERDRRPEKLPARGPPA